MPPTPSQPPDDVEPEKQDFDETVAGDMIFGGTGRIGKKIAGATNYGNSKKHSEKHLEKPPSDSVKDRLIGSIVAERYKILSFLGRGGMSTVYRAEHLLTKKIVALKVMHAHLLDDDLSVRRFQQEATAACRLTHPNAIQVHDLGMTDAGMPFLTMEYLEGLSLAEQIEDPHKRPDVDQSLDIFIQACDAIQEAHEHGIIHRDIKPSNVMLVRSHKNKGREDVVKVLDFGIAKMSQENSEGAKLTGTGEIFGSPVYMSPEQCLGKELDARSDIYSMGCLMYEVLCGKPPLLGPTLLATMYLQMNQIPQGLSRVNGDPRFVKDLEHIVLKTLEKDPAKRYESMAALKEALIQLQGKKQSGFPLVAHATMSVSAFIRNISNKLGPAKHVILPMMALFLLGIAIALPMLTAWLWQKAPAMNERYIDYMTEGHNSTIKNFAKEAQNDMLVEQSRAWSANLMTEERPESLLYTEKNFGERLLFKHNYANAAERFERALDYANELRQKPLLDVAEILSELAFCKLQQGQYASAQENALHSSKLFNYIDVCSDLEAVNAFATSAHAFEKAQKKELAMGSYLLYTSYWDAFHNKFKEREPNRLAATAMQAADYLARSPLDFSTRVIAIQKVELLISNAPSSLLPGKVTYSVPSQAAQNLQAAVKEPDKLAQDLYGYGIATFDSQGTQGAYNAGAGYNNLGLLKLKQSKYAEALTCFKKAERSMKLAEEGENKALALIKFSEADCQWRMNQYQDALENSWNARTQWSSNTRH